MKTNNCDDCHLGLQAYKTTHQIIFHIFKRLQKLFYTKHDYFNNSKSIIDLLKFYKTGRIIVLFYFCSSLEIYPLLENCRRYGVIEALLNRKFLIS